jgi:hypothetical protein
MMETDNLNFRDPILSQGRVPGPQVPPRVQDRTSGQNVGQGSERMLSVSGKKKCSHCKEELGRFDKTNIVTF